MRTKAKVVLALVASAGFASAALAQDVAKTPGPPAPFTPIPYPNLPSDSPASKVAIEYKPQKSDGTLGISKFQYDLPAKKSARKAPPAGKGPDGLPSQAGFGFGTATEASDGKAGGTVRQTLPDVAKTPTPGGPVPLPYPNTPIDKPLRPVISEPIITRPLVPPPAITPPVIKQPIIALPVTPLPQPTPIGTPVPIKPPVIVQPQPIGIDLPTNRRY